MKRKIAVLATLAMCAIGWGGAALAQQAVDTEKELEKYRQM